MLSHGATVGGRKQLLSIHNEHAPVPVNVMVPADPFFPIGFHFHYQALLIVLRIQPQDFVNVQAVPVSDKAVLGRSEQLASKFKNATRRPCSPKPPHHGISRMRFPVAGQRAIRPEGEQVPVQRKNPSLDVRNNHHFP